MRATAIYSLLAVVCGAGLLWASATIDVRSVETFYGIASTTETEVNFSEPVEIEQIFVRAGETVDSGQALMRVVRATKSARLATEPYRIRELQADRAVEEQRIRSKLSVLESGFRSEASALRAERDQLTAEIAYRRRLAETINGAAAQADTSYQPLQTRIRATDAELAALEAEYRVEQRALEEQLRLASRPVDAAVGRLRAEQSFNLSQDSLTYEITAPARGVVGSVAAMVGERKSAFALLVTFYEPSPRQVLSYVHEDRLLDAAVGDSVLVTSLSNPGYSTKGMVTGMGSRIVEIPQRLRRMADIQTYGREVVVAIDPDNRFLQREKVSLAFLDDHE